MACLNIQFGDFTGGLQWRSGNEEATVNGATVRNVQDGPQKGVSIEIRGRNVSDFLPAVHPNTTHFIVFGNPVNYVMACRLDPGSNGVVLWEITQNTIIAHNLQITTLTQLPILHQSRGNGCLFFIRYSYDIGENNFVAGMICKSDNGIKIDGASFFQHDPQNTFVARANGGTRKVEILANNSVIAAGRLPSGEPHLSTNSLSFGSVTVGSAPTKFLKLTNVGQDCLEFTSLTPANNFTLAPPSPFGTIHADQNNERTINIQFSPTEFRDYDENLHVVTLPSLADDHVRCRGIGMPPEVSILGSSNFGRVPLHTSVVRNFKIKNASPVAINYSIAGSSSENPFIWQAVSGQLDPGETSAEVPVSFSPTQEIDYAQELTLTCNPSSVATAIFSKVAHFTGHGCVPRIDMSCETVALDFGLVQASLLHESPITIKNIGNRTIQFGARILPIDPGNAKSEANAAVFSLFQKYQRIRNTPKRPSKEINGVVVNAITPCGTDPEGTGQLQIGVTAYSKVRGTYRALVEIFQENVPLGEAFTVNLSVTFREPALAM